MKHYLFFLSFFLLFTGCNNIRRDQSDRKICITTRKENYAKGFSINDFKNFKVVRVYNPWQGASNVCYTYVLGDHEKEIPDSLQKYPFIQIPVKKVVCLSTTHIGFIDFLGENVSVKGISNAALVNNLVISDQLNKKETVEVGYDQQLYFERILDINPDVVFVYAVTGEISGSINKLKELGITPVFISEYLENEPLAKTEWIKFFAAFYRKDLFAKTEFKNIENEYFKILDITKKIEKRPVILYGMPWKGMWYLPGGQSFAARFIIDAGGNYPWSDNLSREAFMVDFEEIIYKSADFDTWINCGTAVSLYDIVQQDERLVTVRAFKEGCVYNNNNRIKIGGGNDYWESGVMAPHIILYDLFAIFHPELVQNHNFVYYKKLN